MTRQTSRVIEAPEPPAIEETTRTMGGAVVAGGSPTPGTRRATSAASLTDCVLAMRASASWTAWETADNRSRMSRRPIPRHCPAPTVTGKGTSWTVPGIQVASCLRPAGPLDWTWWVRLSSTTE